MSTDTTTVTTTETGRRIRGDARMERLTPDQQAHVRYWLMEERHTYRYVAELIREKFGVNVGRSAVAVYYHRHFLPERHEDEIAAAAALSRLPVGEFDAVTVNHAKALAFSALTEPVPRLDTADRLLAIVHRVHKQQIADRRIALDERRADLREQELAAHPPRQTRSGNSESRSPSLSRPPRPSAASSPPPRGTTAQPHEPAFAATPDTSAPAPQAPRPHPLDSTPASVTSVPPPCSPCPSSSAPASPAPVPPSHPHQPISEPPTPTRDSDTPDLQSPHSDLRPSPPSLSRKSPPSPPLFPGSSGINPPSPPPPAASSIVNPPRPAASPPTPAPIPPQPRLPHRELAHAHRD